MSATTNPSFEPPIDDPDNEIWLLRAPAHLDVRELLDGVALALDPHPSSASDGILSRFESGGAEYSLALADAAGPDNPHLLLPDGDALVPCNCPFRRHVRLASAPRGVGGDFAGDGVREDLAVAPAEDAAPAPALGRSGNGSVDAVRRAYTPVPQRTGLKRRWAMPGSRIRGSSPSALYASLKRARAGEEGEDDAVGEATPQKEDAVVSDDEPAKANGSKLSSKKEKKQKKKKEKKQKKEKEKKNKKSSKK